MRSESFQCALFFFVELAPFSRADESALDYGFGKSLKLGDGEKLAEIDCERLDLLVGLVVDAVDELDEAEEYGVGLGQLLKSGSYFVVDDVHLGLAFLFVCHCLPDYCQKMMHCFDQDVLELI